MSSVLTGFGLFADVATRFREQPSVLEVPIVLATASAIVALLALVPWIGRVDVDDLNSLRRLFRGLFFIRTALVLLSLVLLLGGLLAAASGIRGYLTASGPSEPQISIVRAASTDGTSITVTAKSSRAPTGAIVEVRVTAGVTPSDVASASMVVGPTGEIDLTATVPKVADASSASVVFVLTADGKELIKRTLQMSN